jgi:formylglycine-generating enzyme required for sulfatase activity
MEGYDPIMFHNGKFFVTDPKYDYYPVVRITAYGAEAYARFYGKRLPNEIEWFYARRGGVKRSDTPAVDVPEPSEPTTNIDQMHSSMGDMMHNQVPPPSTTPQSFRQFPAPVRDSKPNLYGIRGLGENVSEWGVRFQKASLREKEETQYIILGGLKTGLTKENKMIQGIPRHPWEVFAEVGFRCVSDVTNYQ